MINLIRNKRGAGPFKPSLVKGIEIAIKGRILERAGGKISSDNFLGPKVEAIFSRMPKYSDKSVCSDLIMKISMVSLLSGNKTLKELLARNQ